MNKKYTDPDPMPNYIHDPKPFSPKLKNQLDSLSPRKKNIDFAKTCAPLNDNVILQ